MVAAIASLLVMSTAALLGAWGATVVFAKGNLSQSCLERHHRLTNLIDSGKIALNSASYWQEIEKLI